MYIVELRFLQSSPNWQQALDEAKLTGQKNPLPLEVFKVNLCLPHFLILNLQEWHSNFI